MALCIDDYAEIWVNGELPRAAGRPSPATIQGFNMPQRLVLSDAVSPGDRFEIAVFGINGPISAAPENTVWFREARVEFLFARCRSPRRSDAMSNALKYQDLSHTERLAYERLVGQGPSAETSAPCDAETPHDTRQPARRRPFLAAATSLDSAVTRLFQRARLTPQAPPSWSTLERFIRRQAANRGYESFDRDSFPNFPTEAEPFTQPSRVETDPAKPGYPEALHDIIETFRDAAPAQHLEMLLAYAGRLPELPEELQSSRDTMEQVDECMVPLFLSAQLHHGKVYYHLDVPSDAPTMRGFAGLLYVGLNGATPTAIAAAPGDLCQQLGLQKALGAHRSRGLTALLRRMQRNAVDLARTP